MNLKFFLNNFFKQVFLPKFTRTVNERSHLKFFSKLKSYVSRKLHEKFVQFVRIAFD